MSEALLAIAFPLFIQFIAAVALSMLMGGEASLRYGLYSVASTIIMFILVARLLPLVAG